MKSTLFILVLLINVFVGFGQKKAIVDTGEYDFVPGSNFKVLKTDSFKYLQYDGYKIVDVRKASPLQLERIRDRGRISQLQDDRFWGLYLLSQRYSFPRRSLALRFQQNTGAKVYDGNVWKWGTLAKNTILISGKSDVEIIDGLITPENAKDYRYRIIQNDNKELVGWTTPTTFKKTTNTLATYCYLGNITYEANQFVLIEIYNIHNYKDRDAIIVDWRDVRPLKLWANVEYRSSRFPDNLISVSLGNDKKSTKSNIIATDTLTDVKIRLGDSLVRLGFRSQNLPAAYMYQVKFKRKIDGREEHVDFGETNGSFLLYKEYWNKPGKYEIVFTPKLRSVGGKETRFLNNKEVVYKFTVLPDLHPKLILSQRESLLIGVTIMTLLAVISLVTWYIVKSKNQKKISFVYQQKEVSKMQLSSIRSQLNPHFMFNALAGIQNLMNSGRIDEGNRYLGKFARLTRNVLDQSEEISLADEKQLLEDYVQMEQFRFGFIYEIYSDPELNLENIEIPTMLLQPFVENAIKHGISEMEVGGKIAVSFLRDNKDLILKVVDNGKGFETEQNYTGLGLRLSKNRISLLNQIYTDTSFILNMKSTEGGSEITITLTQWL